MPSIHMLYKLSSTIVEQSWYSLILFTQILRLILFPHARFHVYPAIVHGIVPEKDIKGVLLCLCQKEARLVNVSATSDRIMK
jgi:hypothetical protein